MSDKETTENFLKVWSTFVWPDPNPIFYRLYYHEDGSPDFYTMEDLPGRWIEVTKEIYIASLRNVRVVDGKLEIFEVKKTIKKLCPNQETGTPCDARDVCIVVEQNQNHIKWKDSQVEID